MAEKLQGQTISYKNPPHIIAHGSIVGPEEGKGPLGDSFDLVCEDVKCEEKTWEKGEKKMVADLIELTLGKASISASDVDFLIAGDLLDQIITANFVSRDYDIPFLGIYGACSTAVEALALGSMKMDGGYADCILCFASSNYQTAERQFRTPLEYGVQYTGNNQWTVTGAGAYLLGWIGGKVWITHSTIGKVIDLGIKDANDMGAAMAPAAADTILQHFTDLNRGPQDYDMIITGDLAGIGKKILTSLLEEKNIKTGNKLQDCGAMIFGGKKKYGAGGSGCAASAVIIGSVIIPQIISGKLNRVLVIGTGALLSPLSVLQNESVPGIAHAVVIEKIPEE
ncbi:stage V sporulation protein AD [Iocasia frigidifontis]|uniref:Stage V sporulation protein AD n=1 Tax=Iocasia fonsfrigidae TaxID=2682810 RepID=A0A8A7KJP8_9FIRM|nr:stage V sporulation protein AD [Iocasia fonsfrigidae]QTL98092.1 stage V sporulation protein AD [Iocasia fonsfrigidae]